MRSLWVALCVLAACKAESPRGRPCAEDSECGPGYDCYRSVCTQVCTQDSECAAGEKCQRYRCAVPGAEPEAPVPSVTPPLPDAAITELRAIRRELELLRRSLAGQPNGEHNASGAPLPR